MFFRGEHLLSCIVMMHISFMGSQNVDLGNILMNMKMFELPLCNLLMAEKAYVTYMFDGHLPTEFKTNMSKPRGGIALPDRNNSRDVLTFMSKITDCLDNILPAIIMNLTHKHYQQHIINNITLFLNEFKEVQPMNRGQNTSTVPTRCPTQITAYDDYRKKEFGLRIIYYAKQWVERFTSCNSL